MIAGIESELRDALINLVFNAIDAMPEGGHLHLRTCITEPHGARSATGSSQTGIQLQVRDSGIGMDEETRRRCLEPFFTTKGDRGTGLGLAMVYGTLQRHSADIDIQSALGQGTAVILTFPIPSTSVSDPTKLERMRVVPPQRILVVDDDPIILNSLRDTLEADGHQVSLADGGQVGIDSFCAAQVAGKPFQIVITDLGMPHLDGRAVSRAVKSADPGVLVILLTGWGRRLVEDGDIPAHVDRVLSKPPKLREIRETLAGYFHSEHS
jgi:CheY-like chemotaxis protein